MHIDDSPPTNALTAVTHPDPYPYYRALAAQRPFDFDASLGMWVAAGPEALVEVLRHPACGVRPAGALVPAALASGAAGEWFGRLVRMNDGAEHITLKPWLATQLASLSADAPTLDRLGYASAAAYSEKLDDYVFRQPIYALAAWLGVPESQWADVYANTHTLVAAMAESARPAPRAEVIADGHRAATTLNDFARQWLSTDNAPDTWLQRTANLAALEPAIDPRALTANIVGLFTQTHDACAGLVANALRRLARAEPSTTATEAGTPAVNRPATPPHLATAIAAVRDVIRFDPPVQNTRRFLHTPAVICERQLARGDVVLVVLAAAPTPVSPDDTAWTFGHGGHACPGRSPASTLAAVGVQTVLASGLDLALLASGTSYHPLGNARIARFGND
ncbi:cytochrome P450 [Pandoraea sp. PE-S2T-3]|uniref:cytochrome P450 n=1 Tax=Pandoraea sp. PE-S2T-3 TaxID=1986993 RepID=UPI001124D632|nr:cytochrome P450 [Pandoraea sp. PE-S2T-3]